MLVSHADVEGEEFYVFFVYLSLQDAQSGFHFLLSFILSGLNVSLYDSQEGILWNTSSVLC